MENSLENRIHNSLGGEGHTLSQHFLEWRMLKFRQKDYALMLLDDSNINMARKPGKKQKENLVDCTGEGER